MSVTGLLLVLAAAFCHATWNFYLKRINGGPELIWLFSAIAALIFAPFVLWILVIERPQFTLTSYLFILGSMLIHLGYFLLLQTGYRKGDLSLVYPIARATGPMLSTILAVTLLGEVVTPQMVIGAAIIIFGVLMLTGGLRAGSGKIGMSVIFGLAAGTLIGSYTAWDAFTVSVLLVPPLILDYMSALGRVIFLLPIAIRQKQRVIGQWKNHKGGVIIIAIFNVLAYVLVLYALTFTPVSYVAPIREVSVVLTVLAGSLLLKEGHLKHRLGWATVILIGMSILVTA